MYQFTETGFNSGRLYAFGEGYATIEEAKAAAVKNCCGDPRGGNWEFGQTLFGKNGHFLTTYQPSPDDDWGDITVTAAS